ncbi:hypothetical protein [Streptomyces decoyicus]
MREPAWESLIGRLSRVGAVSRGWGRPGTSRRRGTV